MMKVIVKNNSSSPINVPWQTLAPGCACAVEIALPEANAECVFRAPDNSEVQNAVVAWAAEAGIDVTISFTPAMMPSVIPDPPAPPAPVFDPMNPLGI